jgi:hypothetical protein
VKEKISRKRCNRKFSRKDPKAQRSVIAALREIFFKKLKQLASCNTEVENNINSTRVRRNDGGERTNPGDMGTMNDEQ